MPSTARKIYKSLISRPLGRAIDYLGLGKNYSYYQNYLRNVPIGMRTRVSNTNYLNATKRQKRGQRGYLRYIMEVPQINREARPYETWKANRNTARAQAKRAREIAGAPVVMMENPMHRGLPSTSTIASDPAGSRMGSPLVNRGMAVPEPVNMNEQLAAAGTGLLPRPVAAPPANGGESGGRRKTRGRKQHRRR